MANPATPDFSKSDRLGLALFGASLLHMLVILGVSFAVPKPADDNVPNLEITLVQTRSDRAPDDPQFLAQANQDGGGDSDKREIARSPLPLQELSPKNDELPIAHPLPQPKVASVQSKRLLSQDRAPKKIHTLKFAPDKQDLQTDPLTPGLDEQQLEQERVRLSAEISRDWQAYQQRPRLKFINARTREYKYAAYMDAWRAKVERVGNLNYPEEAKRQGIAGNLLLDVALNADGGIHSITVRRSSGYKVLDDAAIRIVELAAPFAPFPSDVRAETDVLHVVRTWKFQGSTLRSGTE
jgi:protein TonB